MAEPGTGEIYWYSPDPRAILDLNKFHVPKSLEKKLRNYPFSYKINHDFRGVIRACADREETWISEDIIESYVALSKLGFAYSFETYYDDKLAGGLYGVALKGAFFGESMFHIVRDASKSALVFLVNTLRNCGYTLLDTQYMTDHLKKFGAEEISRKEYLKRLKCAMETLPTKIDTNG